MTSFNKQVKEDAEKHIERNAQFVEKQENIENNLEKIILF